MLSGRRLKTVSIENKNNSVNKTFNASLSKKQLTFLKNVNIKPRNHSIYIEAFTHIRDRVCVPRDMDQQAATEFKGLLDYLINALA